MNDDGYSTEIFADLIEIDEALRPASQMRVSPDTDVIASYAENLDAMPAILLMRDPATGLHWVPDGCHRCLAARLLGRQTIKARVKVGTYLDAFHEASRANEAHGLRLTTADKVHRIVEASKHPGMAEWSNGRLAELCGVKDMTVAKHRVTPGPYFMDLADEPPRVIGKDGKSYPAKKRPPKPKPPPNPRTEAAPGPANGEPDPDEDPGLDLPTIVDIPPVAPAPEDREEGSFDIGALWKREEELIMVRYHAWPEDARAIFVMHLEDLGERLHSLFHPDIEDLTHLPMV